MNKIGFITSTLLAVVLLAGCPNTANGVKADAQKAKEKTGEGLEKAGDKVEQAGDKAKEETKK